jgi:hypothetical protein
VLVNVDEMANGGWRRWREEVDGGGGGRRWMEEVEGGGGWRRWMEEVEGGGGTVEATRCQQESEMGDERPRLW